MATGPKAIDVNAAIKYHDVEFVMDKKCRVTVSDLFREREQAEGITATAATTLAFAVDDDVLDLSCLGELRHNTEEGNDRFLPDRIFVRSYLQEALTYRLARDKDPTVVFGSPGVGKSVFAFLAAIAVTSIGNYDAVLYVRKVGDDKEKAISLFWMTKASDTEVLVLACREIDDDYTVKKVCKAASHKYFQGVIQKVSNPTDHGVKIIVDGPRYADEAKPKGADLVTSGGCPPQKQQNMGLWRFPIAAWSMDETAKALKSLKGCKRAVAEKIFDTTGGSIRLAVRCVSASNRIDEGELAGTQQWMNDVVKAQANDVAVKMAYSSSELSADPNSLDRLRMMNVIERRLTVPGVRPFFDTTLVLASAFVARLLWTKLELSEVTNALNYARSTGNDSLYGWHFELWGHKVTEVAIDEWHKRSAAVAHDSPSSVKLPSPSYLQATGTGKDGVEELNAEWLYWKPSIPNFANIDAAILLGNGTLVCLQFTVSTEHGFDIRTFLHGFFYNIPQRVRSLVRLIKVIFVVPSDEKDFAVRIPAKQKVLCNEHVKESEPHLHFVKPKETKKTAGVTRGAVAAEEEDQNNMETDSDFSYDELLDDGWFLEEEDLSTDDMDVGTIDIVFKTKVATTRDAVGGSSPFFELPSLSVAT